MTRLTTRTGADIVKVFKLAAGFAVGYVVGSRAGREKYEQIAAYARRASNHPTVVEAQEKAKTLLANGNDPLTPSRPAGVPATSASTAAPVSTPRPPRRPRPDRTVPSPVGGDPLA
jgi:hypothetical protein